MFKNQTPQELSLSIAGMASVVLASFMAILSGLDLCVIEPGALTILFVLSFFVTLTSSYYLIRFFLYRRIKLIYKIIHRRKIPANFDVSSIQMNRNVLDDVEKEVDEWSERHEHEIKELEHLAAYRRRFIGDVSHELKTPIFNIQGFVHTLLDGALFDNEVNVQYLQRAAKNIDRLQNIVEDLQTINRLESGHIMLDIREFDIHDLTDEVFADLEMKAEERNIRLIYKDGANQHYKVSADKENIRMVLMNLIHNSIKYGKEGGVTKVSFYDMESFILVEVSDNGIGIDPEHAVHVFDRFYRVDKSRSRDAGGTGLGLSIVKHIVEAHKQTVNVRSEPGKGSTFGFTLQKAK